MVMRINVRVTANARSPTVAKVGESSYRVRVDAPAVEGRANERLLEILAEHFGTKKARVRLLSGSRGRDKVLEVDGP